MSPAVPGRVGPGGVPRRGGEPREGGMAALLRARRARTQLRRVHRSGLGLRQAWPLRGVRPRRRRCATGHPRRSARADADDRRRGALAAGHPPRPRRGIGARPGSPGRRCTRPLPRPTRSRSSPSSRRRSPRRNPRRRDRGSTRRPPSHRRSAGPEPAAEATAPEPVVAASPAPAPTDHAPEAAPAPPSCARAAGRSGRPRRRRSPSDRPSARSRRSWSEGPAGPRRRRPRSTGCCWPKSSRDCFRWTWAMTKLVPDDLDRTDAEA